jgi:propanediol dehydratase small subunit
MITIVEIHEFMRLMRSIIISLDKIATELKNANQSKIRARGLEG